MSMPVKIKLCYIKCIKINTSERKVNVKLKQFTDLLHTLTRFIFAYYGCSVTYYVLRSFVNEAFSGHLTVCKIA